MKFLLVIFLSLSSELLFAQDLLWANILNNSPPLAGVLDDEPRGIAVDVSGNVYVTGFFDGTVDFDPGPGTQNFTSSGESDIFFAKYDALSNYIFAKAIGGIGDNDVAYSIALDNLGNIYLTGSFASTVDFDPGSGTYNLNSTGSNDIFIAKYDGSGNFIYAKNMGSTDYDHAYSIAVDGSYNTYVIGYFNGTADFDPGVGIQNLVSTGGSDIFFAKYDASGNYVYAKSIGGISDDVGYCIVVDASANIYVTGHFAFTVDFDPGPGTQNLTTVGGSNIFLAKYDASGNYVFVKQMGGSGTGWGNSLKLDGSGNIYISGSFENTVDFDPGPGTQNLTSTTGLDIYFGKYDMSGNYVFVKALPGSGTNDLTECIFLGGSGNIYVAGTFDGTIDFDPNAGIQNRSSAGGYDAFVALYDASGNYLSSKTFGSSGSDAAWAVASDASGKTYLTGYIEGSVDFSPTTQLTATNSVDIFIAKYNSLSPLPVTLTEFAGKNQGSINKLSWTTATEIDNAGFELQRSNDGINFKRLAYITSKATSGNSTAALSYVFDDVNPLNGDNYYRLKQIDINDQFTYSKVLVIRIAKPNEITVRNIFPNPTLDKVCLKIFTARTKQVSIIISNSSGMMVMKTETYLMNGDNQIELDVKSLAKGEYFLDLIYDRHQTSCRFIK